MRFETVLGVFCLLAVVKADGTIDKSKQCPKHIIKHADNSEIQSPFFGIIPEHFRCWYNISAPENKVVKLVVDTMDFPEPVEFSKLNKKETHTCLYEYIEFFDKNDASLGRYCGKKSKGEAFEFNQQTMNILFHSYNQKSNKGFQMKIQFAQAKKAGKVAEAPTSTLLLGPRYGSMYCGGQSKIEKVEENIQTVMSSKSLSCMWDMTSNNTKGINVKVKLPASPNECKSSQFQVVFLNNNEYLDSEWISGKCQDLNKQKVINKQFQTKVNKLRTVVFGFVELTAASSKKLIVKMKPKRQA